MFSLTMIAVMQGITKAVEQNRGTSDDQKRAFLINTLKRVR